MAKRKIDWDRRVGRQLRLRDLHVLQALAQFGSMARAASYLSVTQPAISQSLADLEAVVGVRLVDRSPRGVSPTLYGEALLRRSVEALDSLKLGMRDIEFLRDPGSGEVSVGADMSYIAGGFVSAIIDRLSDSHPQLAVHVVETTTTAAEPAFRELRNREVDVMLGRLSAPITDDDLKVERLLDEAIVVAVSSKSRWATRRKIALQELQKEPWILAPGKNIARSLVEDAFRAQGLTPPRPLVTTFSMQLRMQLLANGQHLTVFTDTAVRYSAERWSLKVLPIDLGRRLPVVAVTLKHRTLTPAAHVFLESVRAVTRSLGSPAVLV